MVSHYYVLESGVSTPRSSIIKAADASLSDYNSEYHYIFSRLHQYRGRPLLSRDDAFLTANLARKLLESFFSFKYPKHRNDIAQLFTSAMKGCVVTTEITKEKIYRFINKFSHSDVIEINEDTHEVVMGEAASVVEDIFRWIEEVDQTHYSEMLEVVS